MEEAIGIEGLLVELRPVVIAFRDRRAFQEDFVVLTNLDLYTVDRASTRAYCERLTFVITRHCGKALRQAVTDNHADTDAMDKLFHLRGYIGSCCREDIRMLQANLLAHKTEHRLVGKFIFQTQRQWRALTFGEIIDVIFFTYFPRTVEDLLLGNTGAINLCLYSLIHFLPETRHTRHTGRMRLTHRILDLMRIDVDDKRRTLRETEVSPASLEDMREGEEVDDAILIRHRHTSIVGLEGGGILTIGEHHTFRLARRTTRIKDVAEIIVTGLLP